jgi:hypothetical protein
MIDLIGFNVKLKKGSIFGINVCKYIKDARAE